MRNPRPTPVLERRGFMLPAEGSEVTVDLPGERTRALVLKRIDESAIVVELMSAPAARSHSYRRGDKVPCRLTRSDLGETVWKAIDDRQFIADMAERQEAKRAPKRRAG